MGDGIVFRADASRAGVEVPLQYKIGVRSVEVGMSLVWLYLIWTRIVKPIRDTGQPNTAGLLGIAKP